MCSSPSPFVLSDENVRNRDKAMWEIAKLQLMILFLIMIGYIIKKKNIITDGGKAGINDLTIFVILPCNILNAFLSSSTGGLTGDYMWILIISILIQILCVCYGRVIFRKEEQGRRICLQYGTICSNAGFLGNPVAEGLYGSEGLIMASIYLIPQRIMMWSSGLSLFSGQKDRKALVRKVITHPCIIACILGCFFMGTGITLPSVLLDTVAAVGRCNTAISMMIIGMILSEADFRHFLDRRVCLFSLHRLVALPLLTCLLCLLFPISHKALGLCVILAGMPAGATTSILAEKYGIEPEFATRLVMISTILSLPTISIWSVILR